MRHVWRWWSISRARWAAADTNLTQPDVVDAVSMNAGITLAKWFKHEARRVYAMLDESDAERDERRLVDWIGRKGGTVTPREVQQGYRWLKEPGAAETALEELARAGRGAWRDVRTTSKGGRPARVFVLSTVSTVYETPANSRESEGSVDVDRVDAHEDSTQGGDRPASLFGDGTPAGPYLERY